MIDRSRADNFQSNQLTILCVQPRNSTLRADLAFETAVFSIIYSLQYLLSIYFPKHMIIFFIVHYYTSCLYFSSALLSTVIHCNYIAYRINKRKTFLPKTFTITVAFEKVQGWCWELYSFCWPMYVKAKLPIIYKFSQTINHLNQGY